MERCPCYTRRQSSVSRRQPVRRYVTDTMWPWFAASGTTQNLIEDQYKRQTSAARLGYEQHHLQDSSPIQSPSLSDARVRQADRKPCDRGEARPVAVPGRALRPGFWAYTLQAFGRLRCWLAARA